MISLKENLDHILTKKIVKFIAKVKKKKKKGIDNLSLFLITKYRFRYCKKQFFKDKI